MATPLPIPPGPPATADGLAYLDGHASRRPVWAVSLSAGHEAGGVMLARRFRGIGPVSEEVARWDRAAGLCRLEARQPHLGEEASATVEAAGTGLWRVRYALARDGQVREGVERVSLPLVSLAALPLFAAGQAAALLAGRVVKARFPVLKVMRSATVALRASRAAGQGVEVAVTPTNPLLRLLFGTTTYAFTADMGALTGYRGLLDPRDRKADGRWHEYLGRVELDRPLPLGMD